MAKRTIQGVVLGPGRVDRVTLEESPDQWEGGVPSSFAGPEDPLDGPGLAEALHPHAAALRGPCAIALPAGKCLLRVVDLPSTDPDEMEGMIELQIDKFSPFPVDQLQVSHEVLEAVDGRCRVLIAAVPRSRIDALGEAFHGIGGQPHRIDVDALCYWRMIEASADAPARGREVLLVALATDTVLIVADDGVPTVFRALGPPGGMDREAYCATLADETGYALTSMEAEWGPAERLRFAVWFEGDEPRDLARAIREQHGADCALHPLAALPPLTVALARRAVAGEARRLNLAPPEWERSEQSARARRKLLLATGALLLVWLTVIAVFMALLAGQRARLAQTRMRLQALETPAAEVKAIRDKAEVLQRYVDQTYSALEILRELSLLLPQGVELNGMTFARGGTVSIRGSADSRSPIYQFQEGLQQSALLRDVRLGQVDTQRGRNIFRLTAEAGETAP